MLEFTEQKDVPFNAITYDFISRFVNYLRSKNMAVNTVHKHHKNIKKFVDIAIKKGLIETANPCRDIKVKSEEKPRKVLSVSQREAIELLTFNENDTKLVQVRDMFLFACYTGLRISDACGLRPEHVKQTEQGFKLDFYSQKTKKRAELPLYNLFPVQGAQTLPEQLLSKYLTGNRPFVFSKLSEQYINRHLKVIAQLANIPFNLTFHIGRETFATFLAQRMPVATLRPLLQHSDIKTTMRYVHIQEQMINESLTKVDWK